MNFFRRFSMLISLTGGYLTLSGTRALAACDVTKGAAGGADCAVNGVSGIKTNSLTDNIKNVTNTMLLLIGIIAVIVIIVGAFRYVLSGGNESSTKAAKDTILYAVIGLVVAMLAYAIVRFVVGRF